VNAKVDHLAVVADTLEQGASWCEETFGVVPAAGGKHPLMGTHNRLMALSSERFPATYLEIIAIDPDAPAPPRPRWFAMDNATLRAAVRQQPRLVHAIARTQMIEMLRWGLINSGRDPGVPLAMHRDAPTGRLNWRITVREDGSTECGGALPTLIQRDGSEHPCDRLPTTGVALRDLTLRGVPPQAADVLKLSGVQLEPRADTPSAQSALTARFDTPRGAVVLQSWP
jgi:Glyoxalase-like domain